MALCHIVINDYANISASWTNLCFSSKNRLQQRALLIYASICSLFSTWSIKRWKAKLCSIYFAKLAQSLFIYNESIIRVITSSPLSMTLKGIPYRRNSSRSSSKRDDCMKAVILISNWGAPLCKTIKEILRIESSILCLKLKLKFMLIADDY